MSKIGFRRELLGFNREDVIEYIRKSQKEFNTREENLVASVDKLNCRNAQLIDELSVIPELEAKLTLSEATVLKLQEELDGLEEKKAQLERMSQDIAKMYLVAKSNADSINRSTKESSERTFYEINKSLTLLENMHTKLNNIKDSINLASSNYVNELSSIFETFEDAKVSIKEIYEQIENVDEKVNIPNE